MKKQLMLVGIIVILLTVGFSGCNEIGLTHIGDLQANPGKYLGKEVKVKGEVNFTHISDDKGHSFLLRTEIGLSGQYYLTGIVKYASSADNYYYLDVTKTDAI
ncbi:MAG: hypothetical protein MUO82_05450 [Candidatus Thermoplasmatota archaeon]|nr:hypothetical protein [Candidatus Thermoplasmatota archaeon]